MGDSGLIFLSVTYLVVIRGVVADHNPLASPSPSQRDGETMVPVKLLKNMKVPVSSHRLSMEHGGLHERAPAASKIILRSYFQVIKQYYSQFRTYSPNRTT